MEQDPNKPKPRTSILYRISNVHFEDVVVFHFNDIVDVLGKGPQAVGAFLTNLWGAIHDRMKEQAKLIDVVDIDREIKPEDFDVTINQIPNEAMIYFIHFPQVDNSDASYDGASKIVALALTKDIPRVLTMEYGHSHVIDEGKPCFFLGEWKFNYLTGKSEHLNYGPMERDTTEHFASRVMEILIPKQDGSSVEPVAHQTF